MRAASLIWLRPTERQRRHVLDGLDAYRDCLELNARSGMKYGRGSTLNSHPDLFRWVERQNKPVRTYLPYNEILSGTKVTRETPVTILIWSSIAFCTLRLCNKSAGQPGLLPSRFLRSRVPQSLPHSCSPPCSAKTLIVGKLTRLTTPCASSGFFYRVQKLYLAGKERNRDGF